MGRTKLGGNRIADKSIGNNHIKDDFKLPESFLELNHPTHGHENKSAIDIIKNSNPSLVKSIDLKDIALAIIQVADARKSGLTLKNTIESKVDIEDFEVIVKAIDDAKAGNGTLKETLEKIAINLDDKLNHHIGLISHKELDDIYNEVSNARGVYTSLRERIDAAGTGSAGGTVTGNIVAMTPWTCTIALAKDQTEIDVPNAFIPGNNSLMVYDENMLLMPGVDNDYVEVSNNKIKLNYTLDEGTVIRMVGTNTGRLFDWCIRVKSSKDQMQINTVYDYTPKNNDLMVYEDGILLQENIDFIEVDNKTIRFTEALPGECNITICKRRF